MDNPQQLARTGALAAWVNAVLGLVITLLIVVADKSVPVALIPALIWCALGLVFAAFVTVSRAAAAKRSTTLKWPTVAWRIALITVEMVWVAGLVAMTGGLRSPVWVLMVTVAVFVADVVERKGLATFTLLALGMLFAAALASGTLQRRGAAVVARRRSDHPADGGLRRDAQDGHPRGSPHATSEAGRRAVGLVGTGRRRRPRGCDTHVRRRGRRPRSLAVNIDETLVSLRMLVDRVRDGGERISESAQELQAAAESQASSSSQADRCGH